MYNKTQKLFQDDHTLFTSGWIRHVFFIVQSVHPTIYITYKIHEKQLDIYLTINSTHRLRLFYPEIPMSGTRVQYLLVIRRFTVQYGNMFGRVHSLKSHIGRAVRRVQYDFTSCVRVQIYPVLYSKTSYNLFILHLINEA